MTDSNRESSALQAELAARLAQGIHPRDLVQDWAAAPSDEQRWLALLDALVADHSLDALGRLWAHAGWLISHFWGPAVLRPRLTALGATATDVMLILEHYAGGDTWPRQITAQTIAIYGRPLADLDKTGQIKAYRYLRDQRGFPENVIRKLIAKELSWYDSPIRIPGDPNRPFGRDVDE